MLRSGLESQCIYWRNFFLEPEFKGNMERKRWIQRADKLRVAVTGGLYLGVVYCVKFCLRLFYVTRHQFSPPQNYVFMATAVALPISSQHTFGAGWLPTLRAPRVLWDCVPLTSRKPLLSDLKAHRVAGTHPGRRSYSCPWMCTLSPLETQRWE